MRFLIRLLQRLLIFALGVFSVWLIVFVVFEFADRRLPWILALGLTYAIGAYIILPRAVRMGLKILQRKHVPSFTITGDGLPGRSGQSRARRHARTASRRLRGPRAGQMPIGWVWQARGAWSAHSYSTHPIRPPRSAPSTFTDAARTSASRRRSMTARASAITYDFLGPEPRACRGHRWEQPSFWLNTDRPAENDTRVLSGSAAGTRDTGFSLTQLTFQITHATDSDTNAERDFIVAELRKIPVIEDVQSFQSGQTMNASTTTSPMGR